MAEVYRWERWMTQDVSNGNVGRLSEKAGTDVLSHDLVSHQIIHP